MEGRKIIRTRNRLRKEAFINIIDNHKEGILIIEDFNQYSTYGRKKNKKNTKG